MCSPLRIGLTGGIASGKSTAAERFVELGVPVIDADEVARSLVAPGQAALDRIVEEFGPGILDPRGHLDRRALRDIVFADDARRGTLEQILHPLIRSEMDIRASGLRTPYFIMAIPLLVEAAQRERVDRVLVVDLDEELQLQRLMRRDAIARKQAAAMVRAQASRATRLGAADDVIANTGSVLDLRRAVDGLHERYLALGSRAAPAA